MSVVNRFCLAGRLDQNILRRAPLGFHHSAVETGEAYCFDSAIPEGGKDLGVDLSAEDHLREFERVVVRHTSPLDDGLNDAELLRKLVELFAAAMNDANSNSDLMQKRELLGERYKYPFILGDFA